MKNRRNKTYRKIENLSNGKVEREKNKRRQKLTGGEMNIVNRWRRTWGGGQVDTN